MKKGYIYAILGLVLGVSLGAGVLHLKRLLSAELVSILADEVAKSGPRHFEYDSISVSILTLSATASNVRIIEQGATKLFFSHATANFSLRHILDKEIILSELLLKDGYSVGVSPRSTTYQFVDYLTIPLPPEKRTPDHWKIRLERIRVENASFTERLTYHDLIGRNISLEVQRLPDDNFSLRPVIPELSLRNHKSQHELLLGKGLADIYLADGFVRFDSITIEKPLLSVSVHGITFKEKGYALEGSLNYDINARAFELPDWIQGALVGQGELAGDISKPEIKANFTLPEKKDLLITSPEILPSHIDPMNGLVHLKPFEEPGLVIVPEISGRTQYLTFNLFSPLTLTGANFAGSIAGDFDDIKTPLTTLKGMTGKVEISGTLQEPVFTFDGDLPRNPIKQLSLVPHKLSARYVNDQIRFSVVPTSVAPTETSQVALTADGGLDITEDGGTLSPTVFTMNLIPPATNPRGIRVMSSGKIYGPLHTIDLHSEAELQVTREGATPLIKGRATFENGILSVDAEDSSSALRGTLTSNIAKDQGATLAIHSERFDPTLFVGGSSNSDRRCSTISFDANYHFDWPAPLNGEGELKANQAVVGCAPYDIKLLQPSTMPISLGVVQLKNFLFGKGQSSLALNGTVSLEKGYRLKADGKVGLETFLEFVPSVDDLSGQAQIDAGIEGPLFSPQLTGHVSVENAGIEVEAQELSLRDIRGILDFEGTSLKISNLEGRLNDGTIKLGGSIQTLDLAASHIEGKVSELTLEPLRDSSVTLSADLVLAPDTLGNPLLSGTIDVQGGEFQKNFNLAGILRSVADSVLTRPLPIAQAPASSDLPPIPLAIRVRAPGNLSFTTNWAEAALRADLQIGGTLANPQPRGKADIVSGWLGLRDRRFEISSGALEFEPPSLEPTLEVTAETTVRSREGDTVLVILQVNGPLSNPKFSLSSDRGFSEQELLRLITDSTEITSTSRMSTVGQGFEIDTLDFIEDRSYLGLGRLVRDLARIDSISVEPQFNTQTGLIEPTITATKKLFDRLSLVGQTSVGGSVNESRLKLLYELTSALELSALAESQSRDKNTSLGVDASYRFLGDQRRFLTIIIKGNRAFRDIDILKALRINDNSRIRRRRLAALGKEVTDFYRKAGFFHTKAEATCTQAEDEGKNPPCNELLIKIEENEPTVIDRVELYGDDLPQAVSVDRIQKFGSERVASEELLRRFSQALVGRLRAEGFISARVDTAIEPIAASEKESTTPRAVLKLKITLGDPVTFLFKGNKVFSPEEFLETINLFGRKQPFGNNTINILVQNMDRKYSEAGYLFATISFTKERDPSTRRLVYLITIDEGPKVPVAAVNFDSDGEVSKEKLHELVVKYAPELENSIFFPRYAVAEDLERNARLLQQIYSEQGYPRASVSHEVRSNEANTSAIIEYHINEGAAERTNTFEIHGMPEGVGVPDSGAAPYTIPAANRLIEELLSVLQNEGYMHASIVSSLEAENAPLVLRVSAGPQSKIANIIIEGNANVSEKTIKEQLLFKVGDPWRNTLIDESRRRLLRLGLFSRVVMAPQSEPVDSENEVLVVHLTERTLRSLELGGGGNSELGLHLFGEASDREWFADGRNITVRLDTYYDRVASAISRGVASITYADPTFLDLPGPIGYVSDLRYQKLNQDTLEFDLDRISFSNYLHRSWESGLSASTGHTFSVENLDNVSPDAIIGAYDFGQVRLSSIAGVISYDQRDDPLLPRRGYSLRGDYQLSSKALGSEANFFGTVGRATVTYPLPFGDQRFSIALSNRVGSQWTFGGTDEVPISQRYYLGGRTTVRGFRENSLGPRGAEGSIIGGDLLLVQNAELRYLIADATSLLVFFDAGGLYLHDRPISINDYRTSTGIGVRYLSPIGPIGVDLGFPLDEQSGEPSFRLHFNIGTNF